MRAESEMHARIWVSSKHAPGRSRPDQQSMIKRQTLLFREGSERLIAPMQKKTVQEPVLLLYRPYYHPENGPQTPTPRAGTPRAKNLVTYLRFASSCVMAAFGFMMDAVL